MPQTEPVLKNAASLDGTFEEVTQITVTRLSPDVLIMLRQHGCVVDERGRANILVTFPEQTQRQQLLPPTEIERYRVVLADGLELRHEIDQVREMSLLVLWSFKEARGTMMSDYINDADSAGELSRLDHQAGLVSQAIGHLPHALRGRHFQSILDLGCGSGRWALDMAYHYPDAEIVGVDISNTLVGYARARAKTMNRHNVKFIQFDALEGNLGELGKGGYDLVNLRFAVGWVRGLEQWTKLLKRCSALTAVGGYTVVTEGEELSTDSPALHRLYEIIVQALKLGGYGFPSFGQDLGVAAQLGTLLYSSGFSGVTIEGGAINFSFYNPEENMAWCNSFHALIAESSPFFITMGVTTAEELAELSMSVGRELYEEAFSGVGSLFTFYGMRKRE